VFVFVAGQQLAVDTLSCNLRHNDALSSSFKSILRAGDFDIEETRVRRSDDSGVVDDLAPEAPSPSSTISSSSSSSNLSTADHSKLLDNTPAAKPLRNVSGDKTQPEDDKKSGSYMTGTVNPETKPSSLMSTSFNVVSGNSCSGSTPMSLAITSGARSQLTRNIVVVVKSSASVVTDDDDAETLPGSGRVDERQTTSTLQSVNVAPASTSAGACTLIHVASASTTKGKCPLAMSPKGRQQSVDPGRRVTATQSKGLRQLESSPSNLAAAATVPAAVEETFPSQVPGGSTNVTLPSSGGLSVMTITTSQPSTPVRVKHVPVVTSAACTGSSGPTSRLANVQSEKVPSSQISADDKVRQRQRSTPVECSTSTKNIVNQPAAICCDSSRRQQAAAVSTNCNSNCDKSDRKTLKTADLADGEQVSKMSPCHRLPNASPPTHCQKVQSNVAPSVRRVRPSTTNTTETAKNAVVGRLKRISPRDTPVSSSCLVSEKLSRRPTGLTSQLPQSTPQERDQYTGPVICDAFESLRRRQEQAAAAAAAAALSQVAKTQTRVPPGSSRSRQQRSCTRSARSKTGRSAVVSAGVKCCRPPLSRQPSAASIRHRKVPKTPTSAASSAARLSARTPRGTRDCRKDRGGACRVVRRRRSRSSARKEDVDASEGDSDATTATERSAAAKCDDVKGSAHRSTKRRNETSKNDRTDASKTRERSQSRRRSRVSHARTRCFGSSDRDGETRKDDVVFSREVSDAAKTKVQAAVDKHKRSTSSSDAVHRDAAAPTDKVPKDQQGHCKCSVPDRLSRQDGRPKPSCRLCGRRKSKSLSPICSGSVTLASPGLGDVEIQPSAAAVDEVPSGQRCHVLPRQCAELLPVAASPELGRTHRAELSAAIGEVMRPIPPPRSSRRSRPGDLGADAVDGRIQNVCDCMANDIDAAPPTMPPPHADQQTTAAAAKPPPASTTTPGDVVEGAEEDTDVDLSPRFVRKHDSITAMSSTAASDASSRRTSVEKAQGGLETLDDDATLSWHNSLFDNGANANDTVG